MDFIDGERLVDCWDMLSLDLRQRTAGDLAACIASLFSITSAQCGSLVTAHTLAEAEHATRYGDPPSSPPLASAQAPAGEFALGPMGDFAYTEAVFGPIVREKCGPFMTEREFLEAVAYNGITESSEIDKQHLWAHAKIFQLYEIVRAAYLQDVESKLPDASFTPSSFHLAHGNLSSTNILLDEATGRITGILGWECSGFIPGWLAAGRTTHIEDPYCGDFTNDLRGSQGRSPHLRGMFWEDTTPCFGGEVAHEEDLRDFFQIQLSGQCVALAAHHRHGVELRALAGALREKDPGRAEAWLTRYHDHGWNSEKLGPFPFNLSAWKAEKQDYWRRYFNSASSTGMAG